MGISGMLVDVIWVWDRVGGDEEVFLDFVSRPRVIVISHEDSIRRVETIDPRATIR